MELFALVPVVLVVVVVLVFMLSGYVKASSDEALIISGPHSKPRVAADQPIAERQNALTIKRAQLKAFEDTECAKADAAYEYQQQEQRKSIETATINAQIARAERESELREREVQVRARGEAEAAALEKRAEAMQKMNRQVWPRWSSRSFPRLYVRQPSPLLPPTPSMSTLVEARVERTRSWG